MFYKIFILLIFIVISLISSCSIFKKMIFHYEINQGNYLIKDEISKIHVGMTKNQVERILGTSILKDPFGSNIWYYIFRREGGCKPMVQKTLTLIFNNEDILIHTDNTSIGDDVHQ